MKSDTPPETASATNTPRLLQRGVCFLLPSNHEQSASARDQGIWLLPETMGWGRLERNGCTDAHRHGLLVGELPRQAWYCGSICISTHGPSRGANLTIRPLARSTRKVFACSTSCSMRGRRLITCHLKKANVYLGITKPRDSYQSEAVATAMGRPGKVHSITRPLAVKDR